MHSVENRPVVLARIPDEHLEATGFQICSTDSGDELQPGLVRVAPQTFGLNPGATPSPWAPWSWGILPWAEVSVAEAATLRVLAPTADHVRHLTLLGHVGLTAYAGLPAGQCLGRGIVV